MRNLRRLTQIVSFSLFVWLLLHNELPRNRFDIINEVPAPVESYFAIDPLHLVSTTLSTRSIAHAVLLWSLVTIALTLVLGRVFCGWICPMGALSQFFGWLSRKIERLPGISKRMNSSPHQRWKYLILILLLVLAVFGSNQTGFMDPISLTYRSFTTGIFPTIEHGLTAAFDASPSWLGWAVNPIRSWCKDHFFSFNPTHYRQGALIGGIFILIIVTGMIIPRFWCRYLCPLGALLGLLSRNQALRVRIKSDACTECGLCHLTCEGAADPHKDGGWLAHECLMCWNCVPSCPSGGIAIEFPRAKKREEPTPNLGRRRVLGALAGGLIAAPLLRAPANPTRFSSELIRPPGSLPEPEFLTQCIKCAVCIKVCPTNFLQEAGLEAGFEGLWTPIGNGLAGYCDYECTLCGQECPTGAITELALADKKQIRIGLAHIVQDRCLPWAQDIECLVCEEHCPTPDKAIILDGGGRGGGQGFGRGGGGGVARPRIDLDLCIGCAICMHVCPVVDQPAVVVTSIGETRSPLNRVLLDEGDGYGSSSSGDEYGY